MSKEPTIHKQAHESSLAGEEAAQAAPEKSNVSPLLRDLGPADSEDQASPVPARKTWKDVSRNTFKTYGWHWLHRLLVQAPTLLLRGAPKQDINQGPSIVVFKSRWMALLAAGIHVAPALAAVFLAVYVFGDRWVGAQITTFGAYDDVANFFLLVAAKLYETVIVASLSVVLFAFVRHEVLRGEGAPLAAFVAGESFHSPGFLLSDEYLSLWRGNFASRSKRWAFVLLAGASCLIALVVAPAAATVLQPVEDWYPIVRTRFWMDTEVEALFPTSINASDAYPGDACLEAGNIECPSSGWEALRYIMSSWSDPHEQDMPFSMPRAVHTFHIVPGPHASSQLDMVLTPPDTATGRVTPMVLASAVIPVFNLIELGIDSSAEKDKVWRRGSSNRNTFVTTLASVQTRCTMNNISEALADSADLWMVPNGGVATGALYSPTTEDRDFVSDTLAAGESGLYFFNPPETLAATASLGMIAVTSRDGASSVMSVCLANARWLTGPHTEDIMARTVKHDNLNPEVDATFGYGGLIHPGPIAKGKVEYDASFARLTDVRVGSGNKTVFTALLDAHDAAKWQRADEEEVNQRFAFVISSMLVNGMARLTPKAKPLLNLKDRDGRWWSHLFSKSGSFSFDDEDASMFEEPDPARNLASIPVLMEMRGFAYTARHGNVRYALIGMLVYSVIAVPYVLWSVWNGITSAAWQTPVEITTLAMRSSPPGDDKIPSSILSDPRTLRERYCVVARDGETQLCAVDETVPVSLRVRPGGLYR